MASATKNLSSGPAGLEPTISAPVKPIPFRTELSLAPPRLRARAGARLLHRAGPRLFLHLHRGRSRDRARSPFQRAVRPAIRRGRARPPDPAAHRGGQAAPPRKPAGPRLPAPDPAARELRFPRLRDPQGGRGDRSGGALVAQAGPDRQGVDRLERALPRAPAEAPDALPSSGAALWPRRAER